MRTVKAPFYSEVLKQELAKRVNRNSQYSLRAFARSLDLGASALSQIMDGKRQISDKIIQRLTSKLDLSPQDHKKFIQSVAEYKKHSGLKRLSPSIKEALKNKPKQATAKDLTADIFKAISEWYHSAILELTFTEGFKSDHRWIASQLGIGITEAKLAVERLLELGLLSRNANDE